MDATGSKEPLASLEVDRRIDGCVENLMDVNVERRFHTLKGFLHKLLRANSMKESFDRVGGAFMGRIYSSNARYRHPFSDWDPSTPCVNCCSNGSHIYGDINDKHGCGNDLWGFGVATLRMDQPGKIHLLHTEDVGRKSYKEALLSPVRPQTINPLHLEHSKVQLLRTESKDRHNFAGKCFRCLGDLITKLQTAETRSGVIGAPKPVTRILGAVSNPFNGTTTCWE